METELHGWTICPRCGTRLERERASVRCPSCGLTVYGRPAPAICAIVEDGDRVLLGRRAFEPRAGCWDVLGGFMEEGEQPFDTLLRELKEETGLDVEPGSFLAAIADRYGEGGGHTLNLCWTARVLGGNLAPADDVTELRWFRAEEVPGSDELAFENGARFLELWLARRRGEGAPVLGMFEIQLVAGDLDAMTAFYRDRLGLDVSLHDPVRGRTHFRTGTGQLILARAGSEMEASPHWPGLPPPLLSGVDPRGPTPDRHGPVHFALEAPFGAVVQAGERLRREGFDVRGPFRWPGGRSSIYLRDPDGNVVELISSRGA